MTIKQMMIIWENEDDMGNSKILITEVRYIYFINNNNLLLVS